MISLDLKNGTNVLGSANYDSGRFQNFNIGVKTRYGTESLDNHLSKKEIDSILFAAACMAATFIENRELEK